MKLSEFLTENPTFDHEVDILDGDVVSDLISLWRVVRLDSAHDTLLIGAPDHVTGIIQYGIVGAALLQVQDWMLNPDEED